MFRSTVYGLAMLSSLGVSAYAQSLSSPEPKQTIVTYGDLDLYRPAGAAEIIARIRAAVARVCGPAPDSRQMALRRAHSACMQDTLQRAVTSLNAPTVTNLYNTGEHQTIVADR